MIEALKQMLAEKLAERFHVRNEIAELDRATNQRITADARLSEEIDKLRSRIDAALYKEAKTA